MYVEVFSFLNVNVIHPILTYFINIRWNKEQQLASIT